MILDCIGGNIRKVRESKGVSITQISEGLGISKEKYLNIEQGVFNLSLPLLISISEQLGVPVNELTEIHTVKIDHPEEKLEKVKELLGLLYANERAYKRLKGADKDSD